MRKYLGFFVVLVILWTIIVLSGMKLLTKYDTCRQAGNENFSCIVTQ